MGNDCMKCNDNIYYRCRKEASKYNDKLNSRENFLNSSGRTRTSEREYVSGWNASISQKAVQAKNNLVKKAKMVYNNGASIDSKQFGRKIGKHAAEFGLDVKNNADRNTMSGVIQDIVTNADSTLLARWRGQGAKLPSGENAVGDVFAFRKGNDVVITNLNGEFVTVMKNCTDNKRIIKAEVLFNGRR